MNEKEIYIYFGGINKMRDDFMYRWVRKMVPSSQVRDASIICDKYEIEELKAEVEMLERYAGGGTRYLKYYLTRRDCIDEIWRLRSIIRKYQEMEEEKK